MWSFNKKSKEIKKESKESKGMETLEERLYDKGILSENEELCAVEHNGYYTLRIFNK